MARIRHLWLALLLALIGRPALAAPLEAYGKLPTIEMGSVSATGTRVALVVTNGEERRLLVKDMTVDKVLYLGTMGRAKIRDIQFAGDDHVLITSSATSVPVGVVAHRSEWMMVSDFNLAARKLRPLLMDAKDAMNVIESRPAVRVVDGQTVVFLQGIHFVDSLGVLTLYRVELERDGSRLIESGDPTTDDFILGADGRPAFQSQFDGKAGKWILKAKNGNAGWRTVLTRDAPIDTPDVLGFGRDGRSVLLNIDGPEGAGWYELDPVTASLGKRMAAADGEGPLHDPLTGRMIGRAALIDDDERIEFFDPADARAWAAVAKAFPNERLRLVSWSNDRSKIMVRADSPTEGPAYVYVDLAGHKANILGAEYADLRVEDISPVKPVRYKAVDGLDLSGYLTIPHGRDAKALPLIVFPHGGPAARDTPGFDWWAQGMASRGYAVLQVNFRGSDGFGQKYLEAGYGEWGRKMQSDLSDGVRWLAGQGIIDPKRVCIVGASYGGYAALAGATLDQGIYRCAVSFGGVSDLKAMVKYDRYRKGDTAMRYWDRFMGAKDLGDPVLQKYSPALQAAKANAPVLLIHGKDDTVVPLAQSVEMADALKKAGKPVELVVQAHADHWLSLGDTRLQTLAATVAFVEKYNPPN